MTPEQKLKWAILTQFALWNNKLALEYPCENIDTLYEKLTETDAYYDANNEIRSIGIETKIPSEYSRYYESKSLAMKMPDNSWVGWTYWYGGGKHGEPEAIDWIEYAYDVNCQEEEKTLIVQTFTKL